VSGVEATKSCPKGEWSTERLLACLSRNQVNALGALGALTASPLPPVRSMYSRDPSAWLSFAFTHAVLAVPRHTLSQL
jgi:hypothetical protein